MSVNIFEQPDYRSYLSAVLQRRCLRNSNYSLRAYARDIDTAPSFVSRLLNRKTTLSLEKAKEIASNLPLAEHEQEYFVAMVDKERSGSEAKIIAMRQKHAFQELKGEGSTLGELSLEDFGLLLKISLLGGIQADQSTAHNFELSIDALTDACERLERLGWIRPQPNGHYAAERGLIRTEAYSKSESIRIFHQKVLELGLQQLHNREVAERYFFSILFSFKEESYEQFCRELEAFCLEKCDAYGTRDSHDRIYTLGLQLLPVTELKRRELKD
ncbi:MAG: DUF4423 domain-containing protein [Proteobacteria bacterium]|nr:MAG: DUF4423 domain-containing protein [Pseudomonadota bacterium]